MARPTLLAVDDDADVLAAIARDLRVRYADRYRIVRASSGEEALDTVRQIELRGEPIALLLVDQRMPGMTGVEFLQAAGEHARTARRALLTAYADSDAAIRAINDARIDYYLQKPWDPPELNLYPVLDDLLDDWLAAHRPPFEGVRVVGLRWSAEAHELRDFLARNQVPYRWLDVESSAEARRLAESADPEGRALPVVITPAGGVLVRPTLNAVADAIGLRVRAERPFYDLAIVGAGPAGLAAAVYGASEGLRTVMVEKAAPGGQAGTSARIENYLGFPSGLSGADLSRRAVAQARKFGAEILTPRAVSGIAVEGPSRTLLFDDGTAIAAHVVMIAVGVSYRRLDVPGADALSGRGVFYGAATTEATSCAGEDVFIVGAGNSAGQGAMFLAQHARTVTLLVRADDVRRSMSQYLVDQIERTPNITVRTQTVVDAVAGDVRLETLTVRHCVTGETATLHAAALFVFIGAEPLTAWLGDVVERDAHGFVLTGPQLLRDGRPPRGWPLDREPYLLETSVPGIFAAGDVRCGSVKRVASGVGEGSVAVQFIHQYLATL